MDPNIGWIFLEKKIYLLTIVYVRYLCSRSDIKGVQKVVLAWLWDIHVYVPLYNQVCKCVYMYVWDKVKWFFYFQTKKLDLLPGALINYLRKQDISLSSIVLVGNAAIILTCFFVFERLLLLARVQMVWETKYLRNDLIYTFNIRIL